MKRLAALLAFGFVSLAGAWPARAGALCTGCFATAPKSEEKVPLLVVLHGDWGGGAKLMHDSWVRFTKPRNVALLALNCPKDEGCDKKSWWKWNGDPVWITKQIDAYAEDHPIDRERLWIAGWSGGATYLGMKTQEIEDTFAGIVIHGGGYWPQHEGCAKDPAATFFLYGDHNPLHDHAVELHKHYETCGNALETVLLKGADHEGEWKALETNGGKILDWLAKQKKKKPESAAVATPSTIAGDGNLVAQLPSPATVAPAPKPKPAAVLPPHRAGCGCSTTPARDRSGAWMAAAAAATAWLARRSRARGQAFPSARR